MILIDVSNRKIVEELAWRPLSLPLGEHRRMLSIDCFLPKSFAVFPPLPLCRACGDARPSFDFFLLARRHACCDALLLFGLRDWNERFAGEHPTRKPEQSLEALLFKERVWIDKGWPS